MSAGRAIPAVTSHLSDEAISFAIDVIDASKVAERLEAHLVKSTGRRRTPATRNAATLTGAIQSQRYVLCARITVVFRP